MIKEIISISIGLIIVVMGMFLMASSFDIMEGNCIYCPHDIQNAFLGVILMFVGVCIIIYNLLSKKDRDKLLDKGEENEPRINGM